MKTIEEKAKAYDEIIERAKTMLSAGEVMYGKENNASQLITDLIPELAELDDERTRKGLIHHLKELREWKVGIMCPIDVKEHYDVWIAYLEKQKEQDPAWSEEDEKNFLSLCEFFTTWSKKHYTAYGRQEAMEEWLFNRFKYLNPQPKQEWSEEDEKIRQSLLRDYEYAMQSSGIVWGEDFKKKHNWLKSLSERFNLQLKAKATENMYKL